MLYLVHILEATTGGTRRHLRELALGLDPAEFRQDLIVSLRRDPEFAQDLALFRAAGIGVHVVPMRRRPAPLADLAALVRLVRLLRRLRPDVVHAHSAKGGFLGRLAARLAGVRATIYTPHAFPFLATGCAGRAACYRALERLAVRWTTRVIGVSVEDETAARALGYTAAQVVRVPNGIPPADGGAAAMPPDAGGPVILFLGRFCRQKGPDLLVAALPGILAQVPQAQVRLVGAGPWERWLRRQVGRPVWRAQVTFGSAHTAAAVAAELHRAAVLVMPSRWEGLPYTLLEALQAGTPVVATAVGGIVDVAGVTGCAVLVPPHHPEFLAAAVTGVLGRPDECAKLVTAGRRCVAEYTQARMCAETAAVYRAAARHGAERSA
jgi:glycosyltransferase involved in cell wall biosynthesis